MKTKKLVVEVAKMPVEPIQIGGWYEHTDGSFGRYEWKAGIVTLVDVRETVISLAAAGGSSKSDAKREAARVNGAKGGRPKKVRP